MVMNGFENVSGQTVLFKIADDISENMMAF